MAGREFVTSAFCTGAFYKPNFSLLYNSSIVTVINAQICSLHIQISAAILLVGCAYFSPFIILNPSVYINGLPVLV